jgi:hypothetical protein
MRAGWWVRLEGEGHDLRDLAAHFNEPDLEVIQDDENTFWLGSTEFVDLVGAPDAVRARGRELLAVAGGALHVEFGRFDPPAVTDVVLADETGAKHHYVRVSGSIRIPIEANARVERSRPDGGTEVVEFVAPPAQTREWVSLARQDADIEEALAILGRADVRWHDLYHVFEIVEAAVGSRMVRDGWATRRDLERFTRTANSRVAIGAEARHGHSRITPPRIPLSHREAHDLVLGLVRSWLAERAPPGPAREVVIEVRPANQNCET